ncbi:hypothetical protein PG985_004889 [Apiospora marii]|uniref:uncharacterized protein n=1 Tax=Apiospora marii TaxID=335849 RepID=UPI00312FF1FF
MEGNPLQNQLWAFLKAHPTYKFHHTVPKEAQAKLRELAGQHNALPGAESTYPEDWVTDHSLVNKAAKEVAKQVDTAVAGARPSTPINMPEPPNHEFPDDASTPQRQTKPGSDPLFAAAVDSPKAPASAPRNLLNRAMDFFGGSGNNEESREASRDDSGLFSTPEPGDSTGMDTTISPSPEDKSKAAALDTQTEVQSELHSEPDQPETPTPSQRQKQKPQAPAASQSSAEPSPPKELDQPGISTSSQKPKPKPKPPAQVESPSTAATRLGEPANPEKNAADPADPSTGKHGLTKHTATEDLEEQTRKTILSLGGHDLVQKLTEIHSRAANGDTKRHIQTLRDFINQRSGDSFFQKKYVESIRKRIKAGDSLESLVQTIPAPQGQAPVPQATAQIPVPHAQAPAQAASQVPALEQQPAPQAHVPAQVPVPQPQAPAPQDSAQIPAPQAPAPQVPAPGQQPAPRPQAPAPVPAPQLFQTSHLTAPPAPPAPSAAAKSHEYGQLMYPGDSHEPQMVPAGPPILLPTYNPSGLWNQPRTLPAQDTRVNYLFKNPLRPPRFSQYSEFHPDQARWIHIPDPDARGSKVWAYIHGISKKNQMLVEMEGLDGRDFSRCRLLSAKTYSTAISSFTGAMRKAKQEKSVPYGQKEDLGSLKFKNLFINNIAVAKSTSALHLADCLVQVISFAEGEATPSWSWYSKSEVVNLVSREVKELLDTLSPREGKQPRASDMLESAAMNPQAKAFLPAALNPSMNPSLNPSMNPSMNPPVNPSMNPSMNPSLNPSMNPPVNPSLNPSMNPSMNPSLNPSMNPPVNPSLNPSMNPPVNPSMNPSLNPSMNPGMNPNMNTNQNTNTNQNMNPQASSFTPAYTTNPQAMNQEARSFLPPLGNTLPPNSFFPASYPANMQPQMNPQMNQNPQTTLPWSANYPNMNFANVNPYTMNPGMDSQVTIPPNMNCPMPQMYSAPQYYGQSFNWQ